MSGRAQLTLFSALTCWLVTLSLTPLVTSSGWVVQAALLLVVIAAVGAGGRRLRLPRPMIVVWQLIALLIGLTVVFSSARWGEAYGGIIPSPDSVAGLGQLVRSGLDDINHYTIPATTTPGIRLLLLGGMGVIGVLTDALAVSYRKAALAGLPLLALYAVAGGLAKGSMRELWFLLGAAGYLVLLVCEGRDRLARWGQVFGGGGKSRPRGGLRIAAVAVLGALLLSLAMPASGEGLLGNRLNGSGNGTITAVNPLVSLQYSLNESDSRVALVYRTTSKQPQDEYLRIVALDDFDGVTWKPSPRSVRSLSGGLPKPAGLAGGVHTDKVTTKIAAASWYSQSWLPMPYPASSVRVTGKWKFETANRSVVGEDGQTTRGLSYQVQSLDVEPTASQLKKAPKPPAALVKQYTRLPSSLPKVVRTDARKVTRGATTEYAKALKLQDWFTTSGGFQYSTQVAGGTGAQAMAVFLKNRVGYCEHFASTMAAMARSLGIPARVAVGFVPGQEQDDGSYAVTMHDAHAWPELYFQGAGWVRFEPTPTRGTIPDWALAPSQKGSDHGSPLPQPSKNAQPTAPAPQQHQKSQPETTQAAAPGGRAFPLVPVLVAVLALVLLALLMMGPMLWRAALRRRRLGAGGGDAALVLGAWEEVLATSWDLGIVPDDAATARGAMSQLSKAGYLDGEPRQAAGRLALAAERTLYSRSPASPAGLVDDALLVRAELLDNAGFWPRLRALLLPRSLAEPLRDAFGGRRRR